MPASSCAAPDCALSFDSDDTNSTSGRLTYAAAGPSMALRADSGAPPRGAEGRSACASTGAPLSQTAGEAETPVARAPRVFPLPRAKRSIGSLCLAFRVTAFRWFNFPSYPSPFPGSVTPRVVDNARRISADGPDIGFQQIVNVLLLHWNPRLVLRVVAVHPIDFFGPFVKVQLSAIFTAKQGTEEMRLVFKTLHQFRVVSPRIRIIRVPEMALRWRS